MDLGIKGRRAIVTGGGSGIGFETVRQFLEEGVRVLIAGRTVEKINKARDELARRTGGEVYAVQADMSKEPDIKRLVDTAREKLGGVDILVNNAGTMYSGRFASIKDDELKNQIETKLFGFMPHDEGAKVGTHRKYDWRRGQRARPLHVWQCDDQQCIAEFDKITVGGIRRR